jgi:hypothetical protein
MISSKIPNSFPAVFSHALPVLVPAQTPAPATNSAPMVGYPPL